jgi:NAD dependent epimerase/dehydratase family enzyme
MSHENIEGPVNLAAPRPLPNRDFMRELHEAWGRPNGLPAPTPLLVVGMFLLRNEPELVLKSRRIAPRKLLDAGFTFDHPTWAEAAADLVAQWRRAGYGF